MGVSESIVLDGATKIERHDCRVTTKMSREIKFSKCAKHVWDKPAAVIASIARVDIRTAQRMLAGQAEVPWCVLRQFIDDMLKPV